MKKLFVYLSLLLISLCVVGCKQDDEVKVYKPDLSNLDKYNAKVGDETLQVTSLTVRRYMIYAPYIGYTIGVKGQNGIHKFSSTFEIYCRDSVMIEEGTYPIVKLAYPNQSCMMIDQLISFLFSNAEGAAPYTYSGIVIDSSSCTIYKSGEDYTLKFEGYISPYKRPEDAPIPASYLVTLNQKMIGNKYEEPY